MLPDQRSQQVFLHLLRAVGVCGAVSLNCPSLLLSPERKRKQALCVSYAPASQETRPRAKPSLSLTNK